MSNIDNIVDMTIKRVHTNNKMNSITDNSRLINELQLQEEPIRLSSRELFKTTAYFDIERGGWRSLRWESIVKVF